jgi:hypothetical protein
LSEKNLKGRIKKINKVQKNRKKNP